MDAPFPSVNSYIVYNTFFESLVHKTNEVSVSINDLKHIVDNSFIPPHYAAKYPENASKILKDWHPSAKEQIVNEFVLDHNAEADIIFMIDNKFIVRTVERCCAMIKNKQEEKAEVYNFTMEEHTTAMKFLQYYNEIKAGCDEEVKKAKYALCKAERHLKESKRSRNQLLTKVGIRDTLSNFSEENELMESDFMNRFLPLFRV